MKKMGIYSGTKLVAEEFLWMNGSFSITKDLALLHQRIHTAKKKGQGLLGFFNVEPTTILISNGNLTTLLEREDPQMLVVLEVNAQKILSLPPNRRTELYKALQKINRYFSLDNTKLQSEYIDLAITYSPDYLKIPITEFEGYDKDRIKAITSIITHTTRSHVIITHVETEEEFERIPENVWWMGNYEIDLRQKHEERTGIYSD